MSLFEAVRSVFKNYANFNGRARRSEYWFFFLFNILVTIVAYLLGILIGAIADDPGVGIIIIYAITGIYGLASILPGLAVTCRRLHDVGKSGAYIFFCLLPVVGEILLWVWSFQDGQPGRNQYGEDPKNRETVGWVTPVAIVGEKCHYCGSIIPSGSAFCPSCGKSTITHTEEPKANPKRICPSCGAGVDSESAFCPFCGGRMDGLKGSLKGKRMEEKGSSFVAEVDEGHSASHSPESTKEKARGFSRADEFD